MVPILSAKLYAAINVTNTPSQLTNQIKKKKKSQIIRCEYQPYHFYDSYN